MDEITSPADLEALIQSGARLVVNFYAPWAPPSVQLSTIFGALPPRHPTLRFAAAAAESLPTLTAHHDVSTVPTVLLFAHGRLVRRVVGYNPAQLTEAAAWLAAASPDALQTAACERVADGADVVLAMKGTPEAPRCGASRQAVDALRAAGVVFRCVDVLADAGMRAALKTWADWPTFPMLFARGRLVGGVDVVRQLADTGRLVEEQGRGAESGLADAAPRGPKTPGAAASAQGTVAPDAKNVAPRTRDGAGVGTGAGTGAGTVEAQAGAGSREDEGAAALKERLQALTRQADVMAFIKGTPAAPRCGFTRRLVEALRAEGVEYGHFDILQDAGVRAGLKEYSDWPTFPQVYARGRFVGGLDVVLGLAETGELADELGLVAE